MKSEGVESELSFLLKNNISLVGKFRCEQLLCISDHLAIKVIKVLT